MTPEERKERNKERQRRYYEKKRSDPEFLAKRRESDRQRYWADPEKSRDRVKDYYARNRDEVVAREAARRAARPENYRAADKRWRENHHERHLEKQRRWREQNPERVEAHRALRRLRIEASFEEFSRQEIYDRDGGKCHICKRRVSAKRFHIDHLVPLARGGAHTRENVALAHPRCNQSRGAGRIPAQLILTPMLPAAVMVAA